VTKENFQPKNLLIIRFSSFGDIVQLLGAIDSIKSKWPSAELTFLVKKEFAAVVRMHPLVDRVIEYDKKSGVLGLLKTIKDQKIHFDLVYDAHRNQRTFLIWLYYLFSFKTVWISRSKDRLKRLMLFKLGINKFPTPFRGMESYRLPIVKEGNLIQMSHPIFNKKIVERVFEVVEEKRLKRSIILAPSAAWPMKRWPITHWQELVSRLLKEFPERQLIILGGPTDHFCEELVGRYSQNQVLNLAGKVSLVESCRIVEQAALTICADTGIMHFADYAGKVNIALIGPTAFGHPSHATSLVLEKPFPCRPCTKDGRGKCKRKIYQECLVVISPEEVATAAAKILKV